MLDLALLDLHFYNSISIHFDGPFRFEERWYFFRVAREASAGRRCVAARWVTREWVSWIALNRPINLNCLLELNSHIVLNRQIELNRRTIKSQRNKYYTSLYIYMLSVRAKLRDSFVSSFVFPLGRNTTLDLESWSTNGFKWSETTGRKLDLEGCEHL